MNGSQQEAEIRSIIPKEDVSLLKNRLIEVMDRDTYLYKSSKGEVAKNGPVSTWKYEMLIKTAKEVKVRAFSQVENGDATITWDDYASLQDSLCQAKKNNKSKGTLRQLVINLDKFLRYKTDWPGHASRWKPFPYIDTGRKVIESSSPKGLEFYTKYISGGGVIIVGGDDVDDNALLYSRDFVLYLTSKRPEFREILKDNQVRISLFGSPDTSSSSSISSPFIHLTVFSFSSKDLRVPSGRSPL